MKIELPTWSEISERQDQIKDINGTITLSEMPWSKLNPVEQFVYDYEPTVDADKWRKVLKNALENAFMCEVL